MIFDGTKNSVETIFDVMTDGKYKVTETELSDDMYTVTFSGIFRDEISSQILYLFFDCPYKHYTFKHFEI